MLNQSLIVNLKKKFMLEKLNLYLGKKVQEAISVLWKNVQGKLFTKIMGKYII